MFVFFFLILTLSRKKKSGLKFGYFSSEFLYPDKGILIFKTRNNKILYSKQIIFLTDFDDSMCFIVCVIAVFMVETFHSTIY